MRIFTLTMNPAIDISTTVEELVPERKLRCSAELRHPGGGGINVARVVRRLGGDVVAVFAAGGATGSMLERLVQDESIPSLRLPIAGDTREDITVLERATGKQYRFIMPGPKLSRTEQQSCLAWISSLDAQPKFIVISGSLPPGVADDFYARAIRLAKQKGAKVAIDTSGPALVGGLNEGVFLAKPNLRELRELAGAPLPDQASWLTAMDALVKAGKAEIVALSLAERGALLVTREGAWRAQIEGVKAISVVGAGDSFLGGIVCQLAAGLPPVEAFIQGMGAGSAAVLNAGTELCHAGDVAAMVRRVVLTRL